MGEICYSQDVVSRYVVMEQYYLEEMVGKAIGEETREEKGQTWATRFFQLYFSSFLVVLSFYSKTNVEFRPVFFH